LRGSVCQFGQQALVHVKQGQLSHSMGRRGNTKRAHLPLAMWCCDGGRRQIWLRVQQDWLDAVMADLQRSRART